MLAARTFNSGLEAMVREYEERNLMHPKRFLKKSQSSPCSWLERDKAWRRESGWLEKRGLQNLLSKLQARVLGGETRFLLQSIKAGAGVDAKSLD